MRIVLLRSGPSEETLAAYRLMGLDLDATYDEIESSFDTLLVEYKGDPKKKIKLQVAKDRILEDRLRQRMAGGIAGFTGIKDPFDVPEGPKPFFKIPPRLQGIMELPDKELVTKNALIFGILSVLPLASAAWASTSLAMGFAISLYLLYNRGVDNSSEMGAEMRQYKVGASPRPRMGSRAASESTRTCASALPSRRPLTPWPSCACVCACARAGQAADYGRGHHAAPRVDQRERPAALLRAALAHVRLRLAGVPHRPRRLHRLRNRRFPLQSPGRVLV